MSKVLGHKFFSLLALLIISNLYFVASPKTAHAQRCDGDTGVRCLQVPDSNREIVEVLPENELVSEDRPEDCIKAVEETFIRTRSENVRNHCIQEVTFKAVCSAPFNFAWLGKINKTDEITLGPGSIGRVECYDELFLKLPLLVDTNNIEAEYKEIKIDNLETNEASTRCAHGFDKLLFWKHYDYWHTDCAWAD